MVPASMAGSWVGDWDPAKCGCNNYVRLRVALLRCFALGYMPDAIIWHQGEGDSGSNTPQANYQASASRMIAQSRLEGYSGPWFVCQVSWNGSATNNNIRAAQAALVNHSLGIYAGADTDTLSQFVAARYRAFQQCLAWIKSPLDFGLLCKPTARRSFEWKGAPVPLSTRPVSRTSASSYAGLHRSR